jgi:hypothetical protein
MATDHLHDRQRFKLWLLILIHSAICCYSLVRVATFRSPIAFNPAEFHIFFDTARLPLALFAAGTFGLVGLLLGFARFSFGYLVSFYLYTAVLSYFWLQSFTDLNYDHRLAGISIYLSVIAFMLPALFMTAPLRSKYSLSEASFDRLLLAILVLAAVTCAVGSAYHFRLVSIRDIYEFRDKVEIPKLVSYLIGIMTSSLLPFAFAGFVTRKSYRGAFAVLLLLLLLYPVTLTKLALFAPIWLVGILFLSRVVRARSAVVLSLLLPILAALILVMLFPDKTVLLFATVNFRMIAIPATALDIYSHFFSSHEITRFCQISFLKPLVHCPYQEQLSVVMERAYRLGNLNASLLATEGIASVGFYLAPIAVLACGLIIGLGNRLSSGLPSAFVLLSGGVLPQVLLNVPLSTVLLTHGGALLFLLWYITPRTIFSTKAPDLGGPVQARPA